MGEHKFFMIVLYFTNIEILGLNAFAINSTLFRTKYDSREYYWHKLE
jgi:hypothetical protein